MKFSRLKSAIAGFVSAAALFAGSTTAQAVTLVSESYTGADLAAFATDPDNVSINGTTADFTVTNATAGTSLFNLGILNAGDRGDLILSLDVDFVRLPGSISDNDPLFGFTDQTNAIVTQRQDNGGGSHVFRGTGANVTALTGLGAVNPFSVSFFVGDENGLITGSVTEGNRSVSDLSLPYTLDTDAAIGVTLFASNAGEGYRLTSLTVTVEEAMVAVPLPAGFVLMLSAFGLLVAVRKLPLA